MASPVQLCNRALSRIGIDLPAQVSRIDGPLFALWLSRLHAEKMEALLAPPPADPEDQ